MKKLMMAFVLMPMMALATTWYVNGAAGSDSNSGKSQSSAKRTIQAAIDASSAGDTIIVAPGTYAPITTDNKKIVIKSSHGATETFIDGNGSKRCATLHSGSGPTFWIEDEDDETYGTLLKGFTLKNGWRPQSREDEDNGGGGALGGTLEDCVITNCSSYTAGGCIASLIKRCMIAGNVADDDGGGVAHSIIYDSLVVGNRANNSYGGKSGGGVSRSKLVNCTITGNVSVRDDGSSWWGPGSAVDYSAEAYNCIIYGNAFSDGHTTYNGYSADVDEGTGEGSSVYNCITSNPLFGVGYRLAAGSPCIDAGDNSYVMGDKDLASNARIANGKVDIGCYEYGSSPVGGSLTDGLVAYYPFDGNANDASGNGYHLNNYEAQLTNDRKGNSSSAYAFDGENSVLYRPEGSPVVVSNSFTLSIWAKTDQYIPLYGESAYGTEYRNNYLIYPAQVHSSLHLPSADAGAGVGLAVGKNGVSVYEHTGWHLPVMLEYVSTLGTGWNHYVVTVSDNEAPVLYVNGTYVKTGVETGYPKIFAIVSEIDRGCENGVGGGYYGHFRGIADEFCIYNRALSAAEVKALYDGTGVMPPTYYTVTFSANGGSGGTTRSVASGATVGTLPTPKRSGYVFDGWFTAASGGSKISASTKVNGNKTYYAHWKINSVRLTVKPDSTKYGTVSGGGKYSAGAKATLKATAKKGYAFAGWFKDKSCKKALNPEGYDNRKPMVKYVVPAGDTTVYARFISKAKAKKSLKFSSATKKLANTPKKVQSGKSFSLGLGISSATITKVTAKGLPSGLYIDSATGKISGTPTKAGTYTVKVTVKDAAGNKITQKVKITVYEPAVPDKIVGTYYGYTGNWNSGEKTVQMDGHSRKVTLTVSSSGKVSAKVGSSSFSGTGRSLNGGSYYFYGKCKANGETLDVLINPNASWSDDSLTGYLWTSSEKMKDVRARKNAAATSSKAKKMAAKCAKIGTQTMGVGVNNYEPEIYGDYELHCPNCGDPGYLDIYYPERVYIKADKNGKATLSGSIAGTRVSGTSYLQYDVTYYNDGRIGDARAYARFFVGRLVVEIAYMGGRDYNSLDLPFIFHDGSTDGKVWKKK